MVNARRVKDLSPGDRVRVSRPSGRAEVVSVAPSQRTMVLPHRGCVGRTEEAVGLIVVFDMVDGAERGTRYHNILHPNDEVIS